MKRYCCHILDQNCQVNGREMIEGTSDNEVAEKRTTILRSIGQSELSKFGWKTDMWEGSTGR